MVLVPLDGSELAERALPYARSLAAKARAEIMLLGAVPPVQTWSDAGVPAERWEEESGRRAAAYLESVRQRFRGEGIKVRTKVMRGRAPDCIRDTADKDGADIIAMTTHGRTGLPRLVMGSVANEVVRTARKPVLLVRASEQPPKRDARIKRILVAVDGSPLSESVLPFIEDVALQVDASILLERVVAPAAALYTGEFVPSNPPVLDEIEAHARKYLGKVAEEIKQKGIKVRREVSVGYPAEAILEAADRHRVDVVALSTHSRSAPWRWIMGSTADAVVRHSHTPCLVVRPQAAEARAGEESPSEAVAGAGPGTVIVPGPAWTEVAEGPRPRRVRPPEVRPHRPERSPGR